MKLPKRVWLPLALNLQPGIPHLRDSAVCMLRANQISALTSG